MIESKAISSTSAVRPSFSEIASASSASIPTTLSPSLYSYGSNSAFVAQVNLPAETVFTSVLSVESALLFALPQPTIPKSIVPTSTKARPFTNFFILRYLQYYISSIITNYFKNVNRIAYCNFA